MTAIEMMKLAQAIRATRDRIEKTEAEKHPHSRYDAQQQQLRGVRRTACHIADHLFADSFEQQVEFLRLAGYGGDHEIRVKPKPAITPAEIEEPLTPREAELVAEMQENARVRMLDRERRQATAIRAALPPSTPTSDEEYLALGREIAGIMNR